MQLDPLHQFLIKPIMPFSVSGIDLSFTNSSVFMLLSVISIVTLFFLALRAPKLCPGRIQMITEILFLFVRDTLESCVGKRGFVHFPLILSLFLFILCGNIFGLLPGAFTFTSHIIVTGFLAFVVFTIVIVVSFSHQGLGFFKRFLPPGVPAAIIPLIIPIEIISYLIRPFTLSIRLFANMLAGHMILKIFASFIVMMGFWGILPLALNVAFIGFECFVAVLQAYIFTILSCAYLNDALESH